MKVGPSSVMGIDGLIRIHGLIDCDIHWPVGFWKMSGFFSIAAKFLGFCSE